MANKIEKKKNVERFKADVLLNLMDKYPVVVYPHFYKFECDGFVYDYYPAGGRLNRLSNIDFRLNIWSDCSIDEFIDLFMVRA
jgi:hypothetical protein